MDDYLKKFGFTPGDFGIDGFEKAKNHSRRGNSDRAFADGKTDDDSNCSEKLNNFDNTLLKNLPLTMAYVPMQPLNSVYDEAEALKAGTLFPNLDKPFLGRKI